MTATRKIAVVNVLLVLLIGVAVAPLLAPGPAAPNAGRREPIVTYYPPPPRPTPAPALVVEAEPWTPPDPHRDPWAGFKKSMMGTTGRTWHPGGSKGAPRSRPRTGG